MARDLKTTQELFWQLTQAPKGIAHIVQSAPIRKALGARGLNSLLVEETPGEAVERMEVYAQMYFWRLYESLQEDFPVVQAILGEEKFHRLVVDYLQDHPSRTRDLAELSAELPRFLAVHPLGAPNAHPYLADMARLEWARIEVEREADAFALTAELLKRVPPEQWGKIRLQLIPACRLVSSAWDILTPWQQCILESQKSLASVQPQPLTLLIWRQRFNTMILSIENLETRLLKECVSGMEFQNICEILSEQEPDSAAERAAHYLNKWVQNELLLSESLD